MSSIGCRLAMLARTAVPVVLVACAAGVLLLFPPSQYDFYPRCPIYALLHVQCPGCGTTRALAALLHGRVMEALRLNALTMLTLPLAAGYGVVCYWRYLRRECFLWPPLSTTGVYVAVAVAALFMVLRNLAV